MFYNLLQKYQINTDIPISHPSTARKVLISKHQADQLHEKAKIFEKVLEQQQANFNHSQCNVYFIVSSKFLEQWRDYVTAHSLQRFQPRMMNEDLIVNNKLKPDLKQKEDFQFISEKLFKIFQGYHGHHLKRNVVIIGSERRVPVYLHAYKYFIITHDDLRAIDRNQKKLSELTLDTVQLSEDATIKDMLEKIAEDQRFSISSERRLWKIGKQSIQNIFNHIKKQTQPIHSYDYKIKCPGKKIEELTAKIGDFQIEEGQFFILQNKNDMRKWHFFSDNQGKCQGCYQFSQLKFICRCKKVGYCSQQCQQKDKRFHLKHCNNFAELQNQLNKALQNSKYLLNSNSSRSIQVSLNQLYKSQAQIVCNQEVYNDKQCKLCYNNCSNMINLTCAHVMMCQSCLNIYKTKNKSEMLQCPFCKSKGRYVKYLHPKFV